VRGPRKVYDRSSWRAAGPHSILSVSTTIQSGFLKSRVYAKLLMRLIFETLSAF
jgi:hypothetical protein